MYDIRPFVALLLLDFRAVFDRPRGSETNPGIGGRESRNPGIENTTPGLNYLVSIERFWFAGLVQLLLLLQVKFFNEVEALDVLRSRTKFESVRRQLDDMCVGNMPTAPNADEDVEPDESETVRSRASTRRLECCLLSYTTPVGRAHQIFDTAISLS